MIWKSQNVLLHHVFLIFWKTVQNLKDGSKSKALDLIQPAKTENRIDLLRITTCFQIILYFCPPIFCIPFVFIPLLACILLDKVTNKVGIVVNAVSKQAIRHKTLPLLPSKGSNHEEHWMNEQPCLCSSIWSWGISLLHLVQVANMTWLAPPPPPPLIGLLLHCCKCNSRNVSELTTQRQNLHWNFVREVPV